MKIIFVLLALYPFIMYSQDKTVVTMKNELNKSVKENPEDTLPKLWKIGGTFSLSVAQGSLSNWAAGGEKFSFSINSFVNLYAIYKKGKHNWENSLDLNIGYVKTTSLGTRKVDDRFEYITKYGHAINEHWNISSLFNIRSQFFEGYNYPDANTKVYTSRFFAPAYIVLGLGLDYHPAKSFSAFISPATARWVIVADTALSVLYGVKRGAKSDFQFGAFASLVYKVDISKSVTYDGKLDMFSNYRHNPQNIDIYMTNLFAAKISKVLSATYSLTLIYDDDIKQFGDNKTSPALQLQSLFGAGLLVKF